ncbi:hypothetical protein EVAR_69885_1 [Eumeta japonica]|uniref:Myb/SANT-like DNA-binding domain-containing protein n=1 Tax=Eumeta variegata TaxID=151549 RepID=A0A4C1ZR66_EUMVA|nr:hypothetical protein EVAR_69885_1 [Eumeta japonica]
MRETDPRFSANASQCQTKLLGLKKQYRKILEQAETTGNFETNWPYFDKMNELFGKLEWVENPVKFETKQQKKRKLENLFESYMAQFKKQRRARAEEKERLKTQAEQEKQDKIQALLEMKIEQHKEKMQLLDELTKPRSSSKLLAHNGVCPNARSSSALADVDLACSALIAAVRLIYQFMIIIDVDVGLHNEDDLANVAGRPRLNCPGPYVVELQSVSSNGRAVAAKGIVMKQYS